MSYKNEISRIEPSESLISDTISKMSKESKKRHFNKAYMTLAIIVVMIISTTVTVFASGDLILSQVNKTSVFEGIEMTITDVNITNNEDGDSGEIRFTLRDKTDKDRINEFTDINSFDVRGFKTTECKFEKYDKATKTASYVIKVNEWPNGGISYFNRHGRITVNAILTNRRSKTVKSNLKLADFSDKQNSEGLSTSIIIIGSSEESKVYNFNYLQNDAMSESFDGAQWLRVTNLGFTSKDHFNVRTRSLGENAQFYDYKLYLKNNKDEILYPNPYSEYSSIIDSNEVIFEVNQSEIDNYQLYADICEYKDEDIIKGEWETVFHK